MRRLQIIDRILDALRASDTVAIGPSVSTFNGDSGTSPNVVQHRLGMGLEVLTSKVVAADDDALRVN